MNHATFKADLIEAVKNRPALWNTTMPSFKDLNLKEQLWKEISSLLNQPVKECRDSFKLLRDTFVKKRGSKSKDRHKWEHYQSMLFLDEFCKSRKKRAYRFGNYSSEELNELILAPHRHATPSASSYVFTARREFKENLIEAVKAHENLWDVNSIHFKDPEMRENSWREIAESLETNVKECQTTFKVLRDAYVQIYSKQAHPNWEFYETLSFLDKCCGDTSSKPKDYYEEDDVSVDSSDTNEQNMFTPHVVNATFSPKIVNTSTVDLSLLNSKSSSGSPSRKRRASSESIEANLPTMNVQPIIVNDELDIFGTSVVLKLRRIDPSVRDDVIYKIETALHEGCKQSALLNSKM